MAISILLFEDNTMLREGIASFLKLNANFSLVGSFENAMEVSEKVKQLKPDLALMDIDMPGRTGIEAVKIIRKAKLQLPVLMLTVFDDSPNVLDAIRAGASGYLLKKDIPTKLFTAIEEIMTGGAPMSPSVARMVISSLQPVAKESYQLTARETEILGSLAKGNSYKLVADALSISIDTVRTHIKRIYEKLQVHSQTEAVSKAIHEKLV